MIAGPTFEEMLHPEKIDPEIRSKALQALKESPLDPINLYNVTWRNADNNVSYVVLPKSLTGVDANIAVIYGKNFPSGSHKVGAAYSVLIEKQLLGEVDPDVHTLVWPSTGNYGIGGAFIGCRMGYDAIVVLPEAMSQERYDRIESYGARIIRTYGSESNVKEIYDEVNRLSEDDNIRVLNQFEVMGNYRFHYHVTGNTVAELAAELASEGIGNGKIAAFVSAMGSAGTIAAGDRLKQIWPDHKIVGLEPIQCPTLYNNGYGAHEIQGIGDKHVTWIHNVLNMDALMCIDDMDCMHALRVFAEPEGRAVLKEQYGLSDELVAEYGDLFGISGMCNIIGAIKTAKYYDMGEEDTIVTVATDSLERYHSSMDNMRAEYGDLTQMQAYANIERIFMGAGTDWIMRGTPDARERWHNLKYYTWVEQQGKTVQELDAQRDPAWWESHQQMVQTIDEKLLAQRQTAPSELA
ncbi:pyridoxal-phosphate dependent enzyme [Phototrophicus methaneseepsis]|uniref:Pyridoxal-phosphate dependent enzyme n=1 Tax=Phototrophicus methaneseepsis TaxID=2710758 RepID=A0A7S8E6X7_9CHLR|nr:pyridoxal-phosphate dependent enzyme [Phototrophicus methaneseepsis]QPC81498.1 pyridoxal-phosphate dependent enzyme [Phototrophicus methaneseepsis]